MKIIIIGTGKVGFSLAEQLLNEKHDITIVDTQDSALHRATDALDIMSVKGNGVSTDTLREAGAEDADLLVAATNSDEVNMSAVSPPSTWEPSTPSPASATRSITWACTN